MQTQLLFLALGLSLAACTSLEEVERDHAAAQAELRAAQRNHDSVSRTLDRTAQSYAEAQSLANSYSSAGIDLAAQRLASHFDQVRVEELAPDELQEWEDLHAQLQANLDAERANFERGVSIAQDRIDRAESNLAAAEDLQRTAAMDLAEAQKKAEDAGASKSLFGASWGIAPAALLGGRREINAAEIAGSAGNERVVVTDSTDDEALILLEGHYFPYLLDKQRGLAHGPFAAIGLASDDKILAGLGLGWMVGWEKKDSDGKPIFNFGIGYGKFLEPDVQVLANGFADGAAPPTGETQVRFREMDDISDLILISFNLGW